MTTMTQELDAPPDYDQHRAELAAMTGPGSAARQVRYAYRVLGQPDGPALMEWLALHDAPVGRSTVYSTLKLCRQEAGHPDTGTQPRLTAEKIAELDAARARRSERGPAAEDPSMDRGPDSGPDSAPVRFASDWTGPAQSESDWTETGPAAAADRTETPAGPGVAESGVPSSGGWVRAESDQTAQTATGPAVDRTAVEAGPVQGPAAWLDTPDRPGPVADSHPDQAGPAPHKTGVYRISGETQQRTEVQEYQEAAKVPERLSPWVVGACYFVAIATLPISLNTSVRFFEKVMHITDLRELALMAAVMELALVVCGIGMVHSMDRFGSPGAFRAIVWGICGFGGWTAIHMSTSLGEAVARVVLGPITGAIMLHLALGLIKRTHHARAGVLARVGRELRERLLSRLGLADDARDAAQRTRDRAATRAVRLDRPRRWHWSRQARKERALLAAGIADDPVMLDRLLARRRVLHHATDLAALERAADPIG